MNRNRSTASLPRVAVLASFIALPIAAASAFPVIIDFDTFPGGAPVPSGTVITNQYASVGVTFSSPAAAGGAETVSNGEQSSNPNFLVGVTPLGGLEPITMDLSTLASSVSLTLISIGSGTTTATAYAADLVTILDTISITHGIPSGNGFGAHDPITLTGSGIAQIRFSITQNAQQPDGFGIDDINITFVPTPGAAALLGLGGLAATRRRR